MTVKEVFDLRKQGRIEEAYDAIRPMYAQHKGRYTTLCMFWTAADVFKLRLEQSRVEEAEKIYRALLRLQPRVEEITNELDANKSSSPAATPVQDTDDSKLPWEQAPQPTSSADAFLAYANRRLEKALSSATDTAEQLSNSDAPNRSNQSNKPYQSQTDTPSPAADIVAMLSAPQQSVLDAIAANPGTSIPALSETTGIPAKTLERHIAALTALHLIEHRSSKKTGGYYAK